ncbi:protein ENHANCED DISEASE RESISTANCE 4-like [Gastrolobium bilobum]|uniref:protein ENHANCED DISEASE RESISTANCE 4-like n=1 Tax=Gastrolobium bilobum TaxID=150636 RepID=UPI002AB0942C|nr:protein ENHANCED DISEASE RESISTANCE 4-like [Gastrolobium bilobum]
MADSAKLRLVRCPKCQNLLPELVGYSVYQCGGCGAVLRAKHEGYVSGSLSDEGKVGGDSGKLEDSLEKGLVDPSDTSDVDAKSNSGPSRHDNQREMDKEKSSQERFPNQSEDTHEKGVLENVADVNRNKDEVCKTLGREQEEPKSQIGNENGSKFSGRKSNWQNGARSEMEGFWRKPRADMESVRFSTSNYPDEGPSNGYSGFPYNYMEPWRNHKEIDGANKVQHLEHDRTELLRKLDELKDQISKSSEVVNNPKEKFHLDERMIPPDPHPSGGSDPWFPDGLSGLNRTSRQLFGTDKHIAAPPHFNYHHDPYPYTSGHEMAMPNFHPSMHNANQYGDPFASQMLRRGPHQLPHQFPQQPLHSYHPGRYVDTNPDSYGHYAHNAMLHPHSCSCFHCYDNKRRDAVPAPPASFINSRFPDTPNDPMLYHHEISGAFGPHVHNSRTAIPLVSFREKQLHTRWPSDINSEMGSFVRSRPWKVMLTSGSQRCHPVAGGLPFIICHNCFELLRLPKKGLVLVKNHQQTVRCGTCSSEINFSFINNKLVITPHSKMKGVPTKVDDSSNEVASDRVLHSHGHVNRSGANFSSDDYSGYDFHSVDREPLSLVSLNANKPEEMQSFHSSTLSTSEDENSPEVMIAPREATKSIHQPTKDSVSPPPAGSPLQEYFDYSNNNHAVNRFGKGNRSSRSEQEKEKVDKITSRQNSLKEAALATEMDVHDYSNTVASQDSGDASREHDHPRSNKRGESFFANIIKKSFRDFSRSHQTDDRGKINVTVNGQPISNRVLKNAEKQAGPVQPGNYWYDFRAGFWGVIGGPCLGIIPPFIEEFNHPLPDKCSGGNTGVFVNGRELHQKDLELLAGRGLPSDGDRSYIIEISGRVLDEDTGEELDSLGKLAPTVEKVKHGFGMKVPRAAT